MTYNEYKKRRADRTGKRGRTATSCMKGMKERLLKIIYGEEGMGVVEVILIIVVLIGLVIIFQTNIKGIVASIFKTMQSNVGKIR